MGNKQRLSGILETDSLKVHKRTAGHLKLAMVAIDSFGSIPQMDGSLAFSLEEQPEGNLAFSDTLNGNHLGLVGGRVNRSRARYSNFVVFSHIEFMDRLFIVGKDTIGSPPMEGFQLPDFLQGEFKWNGREVLHGRIRVGFLTARQGYEGHDCPGRN
jgi:hypothetical protein